MSISKITMATFFLVVLSSLLMLGNTDTDSMIVNISSTLSGLCSVATFVIALLLYKRFGIDNTIIENKALTVFKLIDIIKSKSFYLHGHPEYKNIWVNFHRFDTRKESYTHIKVNLLVSESYYKTVEEIIVMANSVFMPIEIGSAIKGIELYMIGKPTEDDSTIYCKVSPLQKEGLNVTPISERENWGTFNGQDLTLSEFLERWDRVIEAITHWLNQNADGQTLNISPLPDHR